MNTEDTATNVIMQKYLDKKAKIIDIRETSLYYRRTEIIKAA
jgi:hypothetical protein